MLKDCPDVAGNRGVTRYQRQRERCTGRIARSHQFNTGVSGAVIRGVNEHQFIAARTDFKVEADIRAMETNTVAITCDGKRSPPANDGTGIEIALITNPDLATARGGIIHNCPYRPATVEV
ncbi:MAG: hypothetical protein KatS3mg056_1570 [Chloroflexus sp.]|jgi:hypothetical protein|nr:MAG: hypothetical protein KatS3mg056_1570 [Chloroflexus sp.]